MKSAYMSFIIILVLNACNISQSSPSYEVKKVNPRLNNGANIVGWTQERITDFVKKTANENVLETELAKLASKIAFSEDIRDFAKRMAKEHSGSLQRLTEAARDLEITFSQVPEKGFLNITDSLKFKKGKEFDIEYLNLLIEGHDRLIIGLEEAQWKITEHGLKSWIDFNLILYAQHLRDAKRMLGELK